jgi:hypothetical protein
MDHLGQFFFVSRKLGAVMLVVSAFKAFSMLKETTDKKSFRQADKESGNCQGDCSSKCALHLVFPCFKYACSSLYRANSRSENGILHESLSPYSNVPAVRGTILLAFKRLLRVASSLPRSTPVYTHSQSLAQGSQASST